MAAGYIEDRWFYKKPDPVTGKRRKTRDHGKGKRWTVRDIPGVKDRSFAALEDAKAWLKSASTDSRRGTFIDPRDGEITLQDYYDQHWWPSVRYPPSTREGVEGRFRNHILPHLGMRSLNEIGTDEIKAWVVRAEQDIDPNHVRTCWQHLSSILQAAVEAKRIGVNLCRGQSTARPPAKPKQKARALERDAMMRVREALADRYKVLLDLGVGSGLRQGEALGASPDDVVGDELQVVRQVMRINSRLCFGPPKGNKERTVPLTPMASESIKRHMEAYPTREVELTWVDPDRPNLPWEKRPRVMVRLLTTTVKSNAINRTDWNQLSWKPALASAGLIKRIEESHLYEPSRDLGFHLTRHTFASVMLEAGESIVTLAKWLGHEDPAFTLRTYTHFMPTAGARGIDAMDTWLRPPGK
ncbi:tyrosine-type recombinase/integrase [Embleya sp. NPDC005971]|uniref:tyrosine-type recombinase/integrase n=1 Tax=Embleya sp. NPDC005971 TaxID=3156724 RepID=UPI0033CA06F4